MKIIKMTRKKGAATGAAYQPIHAYNTMMTRNIKKGSKTIKYQKLNELQT